MYTIIILIVIVIVSILVFTKKFLEKLEIIVKPSNSFDIQMDPVQKLEEKIIKNIEKVVDKSDFLQQNKDVFIYKDAINNSLKEELMKRNINAIPFIQSIDLIFMSRDFKELLFTIVLYDKQNFFAQKIEVYMKGEFIKEIPKIDEIKLSDLSQKTEYKKVDPRESDLVPNYYRILNTLHISDPFLTSGNIKKYL